MRATSPSGAAIYEGRVAWSGELGYGVRPPERGQTVELGPTPAAAGEIEHAVVEAAAGGIDPAEVTGEQEGADHAAHHPETTE
jgi:NADH-quinone oxidoreductase subunit I